MGCSLTEQQIQDLLTLAQKDPAALPEALRLHMNPDFKTKILELWKAGLLSGPSTQGANFFGNATKQMLTFAEDGIAGMIDPALSKLYKRDRERFVGEVGASFAGAKSAMQNGAMSRLFTDLLDIARLKPESLDPAVINRLELLGQRGGGGKVEGYVGAIGGSKGRLIRAPFRILDATDRFFKELAGESELYKTAYRKAKKEGKSGNVLDLRTRELVGRYRSEPDHADVAGWKDAITRARLYETFQLGLSKENQGVLGTTGAAFARATRQHPWLSLIMPFIRTPANIAAQTVERTPFALPKALKSGKSEDFARVLAGGTVAGVVMAMASAGELTGGGPADPEERKNLEKTGWQAYSIKAGDTWYSYKRLQPLSSLIAMAADIHEAGNEDASRDQFQKYIGSFVDSMVDESYLQGLVNFSEFIRDPIRFGGQYFKQLEGSVVPAVVRRAAHAIDPVVRKTNATDGSAILANVPFASRTLEPVTHGTGEVMTRRKSLGEGTVGGVAKIFPTGFITESTEKGHEADLERKFRELGWIPSGGSDTVTLHGKKYRLSPEERADLAAADLETTKRLRAIIRDPNFNMKTVEAQEKFIRARYDKGRDRIRDRAKLARIRRPPEANA